MKKTHFFIFFFYFLLKSQVLVGQGNYKIEVIKYSEGLPSDNVLFTTSFNNYLYVATQRGLCLYDGYQFVKLTKNNASTNSLFKKNDKLFLFTNGYGLCYINTTKSLPKIVSKVNFNDSNTFNDHYDNIFVDSENNVWCSDQNNIKYFDHKNNKKLNYKIDDNESLTEHSLSFFEPNKDEIWIACQKGILVYDKETKKIKNHSNEFLSKGNFVSGQYFNSETIFFTSTNGYLYIFNPKTNNCEIINVFKFKNEPFFLTTNFKSSKEILIYNKHQVLLFNVTLKTSEILFTTTNKINHISYADDTKTTWISTNKGLVKLSKKNENISHLPLPISSRNIVNSIVQDDNKNIWISNGTNQVFCYTMLKQWKVYTIDDKSTKFNTLSLFRNKIIIASNNGAYKIEDGNILKIIDTNYEVKKAIVDYNNQIWLMSSKNGIKVYDAKFFIEKKNAILNLPNYWKDNTFNDIAVDKHGKIWLASWMPKDYGISFFDPKSKSFIEINQLTNSRNNPLFVTDYYNRIAFANNNDVLFSGFGGWNMVNQNGKIIKDLNTENFDVANDQIEGIAQDSQGNIWFACAEGLNHYNFKTNKVVRISQIDGLTTNDLTNGFYKLNEDKIVLGIENGIEIIDLKGILKTKLINQLKVTKVVKDGTELSGNFNTIEVNYDFTELDIFFSALSFSEKEKIIYRYKFDTDKTWNYLGTNPKLSLVKLSPGEYNITIEAGDNIGNWQTKKLKITLIITPPFYKTFWFFGLLVVLLFAITYFISRYFINQEKIKGILKNSIKEAEMQTLRSQMNPHFLFNSLDSINSFIVQQRSKEASIYLTTFSKLMRNILENSRYKSVTLEKEINTLKMYLELEAVRLDSKFDYEIIIDKNIYIETIKVPPLIIQPFAENAIWHGLHNKLGKGKLTITLKSINDEYLSILITDDGIGRKASALLKKEQVKHKSYGIEITLNRLHLLNSKNDFKIIDLVDDQDNGIGTQIELQIYYHD